MTQTCPETSIKSVLELSKDCLAPNPGFLINDRKTKAVLLNVSVRDLGHLFFNYLGCRSGCMSPPHQKNGFQVAMRPARVV